jgi:hypothetical protein
MVDKDAKENAKGSKYYSKRLDAAIADKRVLNVSKARLASYIGKMPKTGQPVRYVFDVHDFGEGLTLTGNDAVVITGNSTTVSDSHSRPLVMTPADILMHELVGHAIPRMIGGGSGNAVTNENRVRSQTGEPLRQADPLHAE